MSARPVGFSGLDEAEFLRDYWQRRPLLIKGALQEFEDPLEAGVLAALAMEDGVDARIVETTDQGWEFRAGPFDEGAFDSEHPWTLLVQEVDYYLDEVAALREKVAFLPNWRFDDVMVSYASDGAGVGPHYDNYDVFLLQGSGQREWKLGQQCGPDEAMIEHPRLRVLAEFRESTSYTLEAGDVLYVPPRLAHWGISRGDSLCYSLGFRAPRVNDMVSQWVDEALEQLDPEVLYQDPPLNPARPGEITAAALSAARSQLLEALDKLDSEGRWFGEMLTQDGNLAEPFEIRAGASVRLDASARLSWAQGKAGLLVYANGTTLTATETQQNALQALCTGRPVVVGTELDLELAERISQLGCLRDD